MNQPWLTTRDWPVSALVGKAAKRKATSATSFSGCEFMIDGATQHDALYHLVFGDAEGFCLFRNLFLNERCFHKAGADDVGTDTMFRAFFCNHPGKADETMLGGDISRL